MKNLLLLLPLIFSAPVQAQGFDPSLPKEAFDRLMRHLESTKKYHAAGNSEMSCDEFKMVVNILDTDMHLLKMHKPDWNWDQDKKETKEVEKKLCHR